MNGASHKVSRRSLSLGDKISVIYSLMWHVAYMVYLPEIRLMGSVGLMYNLLKMMVVADSAGDAS